MQANSYEHVVREASGLKRSVLGAEYLTFEVWGEGGYENLPWVRIFFPNLW